MDSELQKELKSRFNPEGSKFRKHQLRMLEMLKEIDRICEKYGISYWITYGTLLGAVRHKGFIPWDDDLDIEMLRPDYLRLLEVLPKELPSNYILQTHDTDPNYISTYAKLRDQNSYLEETNSYDRIWNYKGIFVDIFFLEKIPYPFLWIGRHLQGQIYNQLNNKSLEYDKMINRIQKIYHFNMQIAFPIMRLLSKLIPYHKLRPSFGRACFEPRTIKDIFPLKRIEFEGSMFPVPNNTDAVLKEMFGDYMELPDFNELHLHYSKLEIYK